MLLNPHIPNPLNAIDFYKADHRRQYPPGTQLVYSNLTARSSKLINIPEGLFQNGTVFFGLQYFVLKFLIHDFQAGFFSQPKDQVVAAYRRRMDNALGKGAVTTEHIEALHDLGNLPICIRAVREGTFVPIRVPMLVIYNTHPDFFWLTNYLETVLSAFLWKPIVSATTAFHYRLLIDRYSDLTGGLPDFAKFQGHDFSCRGMSGMEDAALSGAAHLLSFVGTDTVSAIDLVENYYGADSDNALIGCSVPATEHSVMCMGAVCETEEETFRRLITELYPKGIVSVVSDTWDFWKVINDVGLALKDQIMARDGKVVFRPDSGDPVKVICGDPEAPDGSLPRMGALEILWRNFGGTTNAGGYRQLDPHVGLIYGDSITPQRAIAILDQMRKAKFASSNIVFGIGSYTYQHVTRDTVGMAVKSTYGKVNGVGHEIFKDPVTDASRMKKSARGLVRVYRDSTGELACQQGIYDLEPSDCELLPVFRDGKLLHQQTLEGIRERVAQEINRRNIVIEK